VLDLKSGAIVIGLEPPDPTELPVRDWSAELNWSRDALPGLVPGALVLIVSQEVHQGLFERASDLYSWRRHTARVVFHARELAAPLSSPGDRYWLEQRERISRILSEVVLTSFGRTTLLLDLAEALLQLGDERGASRVLAQISRSEGSLPDDELDEFTRTFGMSLHAECALVGRDHAAARVAVREVEVLPRVDELEGFLALLRGRLHAAEGAWDAALEQLMRAVAFAHAPPAPRSPDPYLRARARECLCQVAFARGDIARARQEVEALIEVASAHLDEWGAGMLIRLAEVTVDIYPDEIARLLDAAFAAAESSARRETMIAIACLRARRWWLLERVDRARVELGQARRWIHLDDPAGLHASLALWRMPSVRELPAQISAGIWSVAGFERRPSSSSNAPVLALPPRRMLPARPRSSGSSIRQGRDRPRARVATPRVDRGRSHRPRARWAHRRR
jgi:hypothetical protein